MSNNIEIKNTHKAIDSFGKLSIAHAALLSLCFMVLPFLVLVALFFRYMELAK